MQQTFQAVHCNLGKAYQISTTTGSSASDPRKRGETLPFVTYAHHHLCVTLRLCQRLVTEPLAPGFFARM